MEAWLDACLASLVAQEWRAWEAIVVDDGAQDRSGEIADAWARRDRRIRVLHLANRGLGGARNAGLAEAVGDHLTFLDGDDVLPPGAYAALMSRLTASGSDFAVGSMQRWEADGRFVEPGWMRQSHRPATDIRIADRPALLGDVFAWNKVWRRSFWDEAGLRWPEGVRYEDQPTTTESFLRGRFDVIPDVVYHWRIRADGTSITQQRGTVPDLRDRWVTKEQSLASVRAHGDADVEQVFLERVLVGDLPRYFAAIPTADDDWWELLVEGVRRLWSGTSLTASALPPAQRLIGWLVEQDRRDDATAVVAWLDALGRRPPREQTPGGGWRLQVPADVLDTAEVAPEALAVTDAEL